MTSGADLAIAIGTIATAAAAAAGLGVSLVIGARDRTRADTRAEADRMAARDLAASDRVAMRMDAERRHIVGLLLDLGKQIGIHYTNVPADVPAAVAQVRLILHTLPPECAYVARQVYDVKCHPRSATRSTRN